MRTFSHRNVFDGSPSIATALPSSQGINSSIDGYREELKAPALYSSPQIFCQPNISTFSFQVKKMFELSRISGTLSRSAHHHFCTVILEIWPPICHERGRERLLQDWNKSSLGISWYDRLVCRQKLWYWSMDSYQMAEIHETVKERDLTIADNDST